MKVEILKVERLVEIDPLWKTRWIDGCFKRHDMLYGRCQGSQLLVQLDDSLNYVFPSLMQCGGCRELFGDEG